MNYLKSACVQGNDLISLSISLMGYRLDFIFCLKFKLPLFRVRAVIYDIPTPKVVKMYDSTVSLTFMEMLRVIIYNKNWGWREDAVAKNIELLPDDFF